MTEVLFVFFIVGFVCGAVYDIFRFFRLIFANKWAVFFLDFLYFFLISPFIFIFLLSFNNGQVRVFYFTDILMGFVVYILTLYRITGWFQKPIAALLRNIVKKIIKSFKKVLQCIKKVYYNVFMLRRKPLRLKKKSKTKRKKKSKKKSGDNNDEDFSEFEI